MSFPGTAFGPVSDAPLSDPGGLSSGGGGGSTTHADSKPEVRYGPAIPGAPWSGRPYTTPAAAAFAPVVAPAVTHADRKPEVTFGPAVPGAPWGSRKVPGGKPPGSDPITPQPPQPTTPPGPFFKPEVTFGPAVRGAPWSGRAYIENHPGVFPPGPAPTPGVPPAIKSKPLLERVPDLHGPAAEDRIRRFTEKLSTIVNSLVEKNELRMTGISQWDIFAAGVLPTGSGLTGTFNHGTFP